MTAAISIALLGLLTLTGQVLAVGEPCQISNSRLDPNSHKFRSDCGPKDYCAIDVPPSSNGSLVSNTLVNNQSPSTLVTTARRRDLDKHHTSFSPLRHETRLSRRGQLQNIFLAATIPRYVNETLRPYDEDNEEAMTSNLGESVSQASDGTGTCQPKTCRKDEFPFGYGQNDILPPRCPDGSFCPDEEDRCRPLVPVGGSCQLNRDDQCQPALTASLWANENNFNGSICLSYTCMYANKMEGEKCIIDNTIYSGLLPDGSQFTDIVSRDNCATGTFCASDTLQCEKRLPPGQICKSDSQCLSGNCDLNQLCVSPPETPAPVPHFVYIIVPIFIVLGMAAMVYFLYVYHQKARKRRNETLYEYWMEQLAYRRSIMNMHLAAERDQRRALLSRAPSDTGKPSFQDYGIQQEKDRH